MRSTICAAFVAALCLAIPAAAKEKPKFTYEKVKGHDLVKRTWDEYIHCTKVTKATSTNSTSLSTIWTIGDEYDQAFQMFSWAMMDDSMATINEEHTSDFVQRDISITRSTGGVPHAMDITYSSHYVFADGLTFELPQVVIPVTLDSFTIDTDGERLAIYKGFMPIGTTHYVHDPLLGPDVYTQVSDSLVEFEMGLAVPEPGTIVLLSAVAVGALLVRRRRLLTTLAALVILAIAAAPSVEAAAKPRTVHWKDTWHGANSWWFNSHWREIDTGPLSPRKLFELGLVSGEVTVHEATTPDALMHVMYDLAVMDDHMMTLAHREMNDLSLVRTAWSTDFTGNPINTGLTFNLLEDVEQTTDGYSRTQVAPISIAMQYVGTRASTTGGLHEVIFEGVVPAGGVSWNVIDPAVPGGPFMGMTNDAPFTFEFAVTVPEPSTVALVGLVLAALVVARRRVK